MQDRGDSGISKQWDLETVGSRTPTPTIRRATLTPAVCGLTTLADGRRSSAAQLEPICETETPIESKCQRRMGIPTMWWRVSVGTLH